MPDGLIVGSFKDTEVPGDTQYLLLSNKDYEQEVSGQLQLDRIYNVSTLDEDTGEVKPLAMTDVVSLRLGKGEGQLLILK